MDPRFLPFQIAAGLLITAQIVLFVRLGMNIYRNNTGIRCIFGAAMFVGGLALGWMVILAGFGA